MLCKHELRHIRKSQHTKRNSQTQRKRITYLHKQMNEMRIRDTFSLHLQTAVLRVVTYVL